MNRERTDALKIAVKVLYDYQAMRISLGNRIKVKKDNTMQKRPKNQKEFKINAQDWEMFNILYDNAMKQEKAIEKFVKDKIRQEPLWIEFLDGVKGVGETLAAIIISQYDIYKADTVSKLWQFTGLNPGMVRGRKMEGDKIILTDKLVRGDKLTPGFLSPFNKWLRTKMCGVLASQFLKAQSSYALDYYYPYKSRLEKEDGWKDKTPGHRDHAAKRYMIKMFLKDLYEAWRTIEDLPVRPPYQEEYLGHKTCHKIDEMVASK